MAASGRHVGVVDDFLVATQARNRLAFSLDEVSRAVPTQGRALEAALRRRAEAGAIVRVAPRTGFFLIVPPEHRAMGCPPVERWLGRYMAFLRRPYYLGLLSAAEFHGSSHFAVTETQVVTTLWSRPVEVGMVRVSFFQRSGVEAMPVETHQGEWGPLRVSTPEATLVDMLRLGACAVDRVALTLLEMGARLDAERLRQALDAAGDVPVAQRLGYTLDFCGHGAAARVVARWLAGKDMGPVPLVPGVDDPGPDASHAPWHVRGSMPEGILAC